MNQLPDQNLPTSSLGIAFCKAQFTAQALRTDLRLRLSAQQWLLRFVFQVGADILVSFRCSTQKRCLFWPVRAKNLFWTVSGWLRARPQAEQLQLQSTTAFAQLLISLHQCVLVVIPRSKRQTSRETRLQFAKLLIETWSTRRSYGHASTHARKYS